MSAMPELRFVGGRYTVEFSAEATTQARRLDWTEFENLQGALYELASTQGWVDTGRFGAHQRGGAQPVTSSIRVDRCAVLFEIDPERNLLRVIAVDRDRMPRPRVTRPRRTSGKR